MIYRKNVEMTRGEDAVFEVGISDEFSLDISADAAVQVDVYRLGAYGDEDPLFSCTESNSLLFKVVENGTTVSFRWKVTKTQSATLRPGDYLWTARDTQNGLKTETVGGVLAIK